MEFDDPARGKHDGTVEMPDVSSSRCSRVSLFTARSRRMIVDGEFCVEKMPERTCVRHCSV